MKKQLLVASLLTIGANALSIPIYIQGELLKLEWNKKEYTMPKTYDSGDFTTFKDLAKRFIDEVKHEYDIALDGLFFTIPEAASVITNLDQNIESFAQTHRLDWLKINVVFAHPPAKTHKQLRKKVTEAINQLREIREEIKKTPADYKKLINPINLLGSKLQNLKAQ